MNLEQGETPLSTDAHETPTSRLELVWGAPGLAGLAASTVMVLGCGGVGSNCIEALARGGVGTLVVVDGDAVAVAIGDDGLGGADLVRREAHGILERGERVAQVLDDLRVGRRGLLGRLAQKLTVLDNLLDHGSLPLDARGAGRLVSVRST